MKMRSETIQNNSFRHFGKEDMLQNILYYRKVDVKRR